MVPKPYREEDLFPNVLNRRNWRPSSKKTSGNPSSNASGRSQESLQCLDLPRSAVPQMVSQSIIWIRMTRTRARELMTSATQGGDEKRSGGHDSLAEEEMAKW
jgi:hypothetical protein